MKWRTGLENLGFTAEQMVRCCRTSASGIVFVPARINDEPVQMALSNFGECECHLYESYATDHGLPVSGEGKVRHSQIETLSAFGLTSTNVAVDVYGDFREGTPPVAGFLDSTFFRGGVLAVDASVPAAAYAPARDQLSLDHAISRLTLRKNVVTIDGRTFSVGIDMPSYVTPAYLGENKPGRHGRAHLSLTLPGGIAVAESVTVRHSTSKQAGMLGADLWCRWVMVFDFTASELLLFPYD